LRERFDSYRDRCESSTGDGFSESHNFRPALTRDSSDLPDALRLAEHDTGYKPRCPHSSLPQARELAAILRMHRAELECERTPITKDYTRSKSLRGSQRFS